MVSAESIGLIGQQEITKPIQQGNPESFRWYNADIGRYFRIRKLRCQKRSLFLVCETYYFCTSSLYLALQSGKKQELCDQIYFPLTGIGEECRKNGEVEPRMHLVFSCNVKLRRDFEIPAQSYHSLCKTGNICHALTHNNIDGRSSYLGIVTEKAIVTVWAHWKLN